MLHWLRKARGADAVPPDYRPSHSHRFRIAEKPTAGEIGRRAAAHPYWYHSFYFDTGEAIRGYYDMGADVDGYGFPAAMKGLRVLDVGTASGWFAFYFEQQGADVTATDVRSDEDLDAYGRWQKPQPPTVSQGTDEEGRPLWWRPTSGPLWMIRDLLGSRVAFRNVPVAELSLEHFGAGAKPFDLVFMGALLLHLRDPIGALIGARRVCRGKVIASTIVSDAQATAPPAQVLMDTKPTDRPWGAWWLPNEACFRHWFTAAGFRDPDVSRRVHLPVDQPQTEEEAETAGTGITLRVGSADV